MNTISATPISPARSFFWLLKREYWEHRGGFLWAQLITGGIAIMFAMLSAAVSVMSLSSNIWHTNIGNEQEYSLALGIFGDSMLLTGIILAQVVLALVIFFYALGSLHDDRRDRSILFWKSLPLSDSNIVLSKAAWALLLAPMIAVAIGLAVGVVLWLIAIASAFCLGAPHPWAMATQSHPFELLLLLLMTIPMGILWSLPTIGWLMLCSAWANSKPFLWAVLLPLLGCVMISIFGGMPGLKLPLNLIWYVVVYRGLLSIFPCSWVPIEIASDASAPSLSEAGNLVPWILHHSQIERVYGHPNIWIGATVGIALIIAAIYLRRRHSEA